MTVPPSNELPILQLTCARGKATALQGPTVVTRDLGLALSTGACADIGRFTVPNLLGPAAGGPYVVDRSAASLTLTAADGSAEEVLDNRTWVEERRRLSLGKGLAGRHRADWVCVAIATTP